MCAFVEKDFLEFDIGRFVTHCKNIKRVFLIFVEVIQIVTNL